MKFRCKNIYPSKLFLSIIYFKRLIGTSTATIVMPSSHIPNAVLANANSNLC